MVLLCGGVGSQNAKVASGYVCIISLNVITVPNFGRYGEYSVSFEALHSKTVAASA
jgi:hypothetical protein